MQYESKGNRMATHRCAWEGATREQEKVEKIHKIHKIQKIEKIERIEKMELIELLKGSDENKERI